MATKFKVGDKVRRKRDSEAGEVITIDLVERELVIKWEHRRQYEYLDLCNLRSEKLEVIDPLVDDQTAEAVQLKLDAIPSILENQSLEEAWDALIEAKKLANKTSSWYYLLNEGMISTTEFDEAAAKVGWHTSSFYC